jgi:hypothetical protein
MSPFAYYDPNLSWEDVAKGIVGLFFLLLVLAPIWLLAAFLVYLALPFVPDWRWLLDRSDSPWYPTMRLFRQQRAGDWDSVFDEIRAALAERLRAHNAGPAL